MTTRRIGPESLGRWWKEVSGIILGLIGAAGFIVQVIVEPLVKQPINLQAAALCAGATIGIPFGVYEILRKGAKAE